MNNDCLDQVRTSCRLVTQRAHHVYIDRDRLARYADELPLDRAQAPVLDAARHYVEAGPDPTAAFFLILDAINFGSGYFPHVRKRPGLSGYFTVAASLTDHFRAHGPWSPGDLCSLSLDDLARVFDQDLAVPEQRELLKLFLQALHDLGRYVLDRFGGRFPALIEAAGRSAARLVTLLAEMPFYRDVERYADLDVAFYKRAQLTAADLWIALRATGLGRFDDLDRLTIFADNLVPHVLRVDGVLRYEPALAARIDAGELIPAHSKEEIEIRAAAVDAVELLVAHFRAAGRTVTAMGLDYLLWNRGQEPFYKARPRHRARTVFY